MLQSFFANPLKKLIRPLVLILLVVMNFGCDQVAKHVVRDAVPMHEQIPVIADHLILTKVENPGAMLSAGSNLPPFLKKLFLQILPVVALGLMLVYLLTRTRLARGKSFALACIIGGGIGNILDRVLYGSVTDFLHVDLGWFQTGIFNLADVSILFGTILFMVLSIRWARPTPSIQ